MRANERVGQTRRGQRVNRGIERVWDNEKRRNGRRWDETV